LGLWGDLAPLGFWRDLAPLGLWGDLALLGLWGDLALLGLWGDLAPLGLWGDLAPLGLWGDLAPLSSAAIGTRALLPHPELRCLKEQNIQQSRTGGSAPAALSSGSSAFWVRYLPPDGYLLFLYHL